MEIIFMGELKKKCFKCGVTKPLPEFYRHAKMSDGHLNKCKECNKKDVKNNYVDNTKKPGYIDKERKRGRDKFHRLYSGITKKKVSKEVRGKWEEKYPEKLAAKKYSTAKLVPKGMEGHHWSYNDNHVKDVIGLTKKDHSKAHRFLIYDQEQKMYRRCDNNVLLDTKESHLLFISFCITNNED